MSVALIGCGFCLLVMVVTGVMAGLAGAIVLMKKRNKAKYERKFKGQHHETESESETEE